jgi:ATP-dependent RNA helicase DDX23/PRP28
MDRRRERSRSRDRSPKRRRDDDGERSRGRDDAGGRDWRWVSCRTAACSLGREPAAGPPPAATHPPPRPAPRRRDDRYARDGRDRRDDRDDRRRDDRDDRDNRGRDRDRDRDGRADERAPPPLAAPPLPPPPAADSAARKEPLSLEALLKQRREEEERAARPVFMSKAQREEAALTRRRAEADAQRARADAARAGLPGAPPPPPRDGRDAGRRDDARRDDWRDGRGRDARGGRVPPPPREDAAARAERERQAELAAIKAIYLGGGADAAPPKKPARTQDRFKFTFDWDASEDTTRSALPPLAAPGGAEAPLLFGRGFRAGADRPAQRAAARAAGASAGAGGAGGAGARRAAADARADRRDAAGMAVDAHWSDKPLAAMTERDWRIFREDFSIAYKGGAAGAALPVRSWDEAGLPEPLRRAVDRAGYVRPSPIQMAAIPLGLQQRDVIGVAETGSGKTAAFVLPMLCYILGQPPMAGAPEVEAEGPYAVVLAPTRELAQQIEAETRALAAFTPFRVVGVVGGASIEEQGVALRKGAEVVVATPGRLVDAVERRYAVLNQCNYVVLDEADRMIDLGFEPQVTAVLDAMPSSNLKPEDEDAPLEKDRVYRTTYMFSATMPPAVERLARKYLRRPTVVAIGATGRAAETVSQRVVMTKENEKPAALARELSAAGRGAKVIVFANTQKKCEGVLRAVESAGLAACMLHGGKSQDAREDAIRGFRGDRYSVLVATDVAGRGIDVPNVALVVNYDMPHSIEAYTHRIGRTGRAGRRGGAVTLLTHADSDVFFDLKRFLEESRAPVPPELAAHQASRAKPGGAGLLAITR